jgi:hypothetical protein
MMVSDDDVVKERNVGISFSSKVFKIQRINLGLVTAARNKVHQCIVCFYFLVRVISRLQVATIVFASIFAPLSWGYFDFNSL